MEIKNEFVNKIMECKWLENCGENCEFDFDIKRATSEEEIEEKITSMRWGNICLEARGELTVYLHLNHNEDYNKYWNKIVHEIKEKYLPNILPAVSVSLETKVFPNRNVDKKVLVPISSNIIMLFMTDFYSEYFRSEFYNRMLEIYLSGHLPCGWAGKYAKGKFIVF